MIFQKKSRILRSPIRFYDPIHGWLSLILRRIPILTTMGDSHNYQPPQSTQVGCWRMVRVQGWQGGKEIKLFQWTIGRWKKYQRFPFLISIQQRMSSTFILVEGLSNLCLGIWKKVEENRLILVDHLHVVEIIVYRWVPPYKYIWFWTTRDDLLGTSIAKSWNGFLF